MDDVIADILSGIFKTVLIRYKECESLTVEQCWRIIFEIFLEHREFLTLLGDNNLLHLWTEAVNQYYVPCMEVFTHKKVRADELFRYYSVYHNSAMVNLSYYWFKTDKALTVERMVVIITRLLEGDAYEKFVSID